MLFRSLGYAVAELDRLYGDPEGDHLDAEEILLMFLREIGHGEIADAFKNAKSRCGFWYA